MTISDVSTRKQSQGNGVITSFPYDWKIWAATELDVYYLNSLSVEVLLSYPGDYTINPSGIDNPAGGNIDLVAIVPELGEYITIINDQPYVQTAAYIEGDDFPAAVHEAALDKQCRLAQQNKETESRTLIMPPSTPEIFDSELPIPDPGKLMIWNSTGTKLINFPYPTESSEVLIYKDHNVNGSHLTYGRIQDIRDAALIAFDGQIIKASGYSAGTENRNWHFKWNPSDLSTEVTADPLGGVYIAPTSDLTGASGAWERLYDGPLNVHWFGATGLGIVSDHVAIQAAIDLFIKATIFIPMGAYLVNALYYKSDVEIMGAGVGKTIMKLADSQDTPVFTRSDYITSGDWAAVNLLVQMDNISIHDLSIDGNEANQTTPISASRDYLIFMQRVIGVEIYNLELYDGRTGGITLEQCRDGIVEHNDVRNCVQTGSVRNAIDTYRDFNAATSADFLGGNHVLAHNTTDGDDGYGIAIHHTYHDSINNNHVISDSAGIGAESAHNANVVNNRLFGCAIYANDPAAGNPEGLLVEGNTILNPHTAATSAGARGIGIMITDQVGAKVTNNSIINATRTGSGPTWSAIAIITSPKCAVSLNSVLNPDLTDLNTISAIHNFQSDNTQIIGNSLESSSHYGIYNQGGDYLKVIGNDLEQMNVGANSRGISNNGNNNRFIGNFADNYLSIIYGADGGTSNLSSANIAGVGVTQVTNQTTGNVEQTLKTTAWLTLDNTGTPSIWDNNNFVTGGTATITRFDGVFIGQEFTVVAEHAVTITDGTNIFLNGSANFVMAPTDTVRFIVKPDGLCYETSRSVN